MLGGGGNIRLAVFIWYKHSFPKKRKRKKEKKRKKSDGCALCMCCMCCICLIFRCSVPFSRLNIFCGSLYVSMYFRVLFCLFCLCCSYYVVFFYKKMVLLRVRVCM